MGSGIAKSIREEWDLVYQYYMMWYNKSYNQAHETIEYLGMPDSPSNYMLGQNQYVKISNTQFVINMAAQDKYGKDGKRYTSYDAFYNCLIDIKQEVPKHSTIGFPDHIGCGLGGADWDIIHFMIILILGEDFEVYIYKMED